MNVESLMRDYLAACTPAEVELRDLPPAPAEAPERGRSRRLVPVSAGAAAAVLLVVGFVVARDRLGGPDAAVPPADVAAPVEAADLLGTWVVLGQASADPADLERQVRMTFLPDGTWDGWDGCNGVGGTYRIGDGDTLTLDSGSSTRVACTNPNEVLLPLDGELRFATGTSRVTLSDADGEKVAVLWRPGGQFNPTASLTGKGPDGWRLSVTSYGSGSCPFIPSNLEYAGRNRLGVDALPAGTSVCTTDFGPSTESIAVDPIRLDPAEPITVTLNGLYSAPITVPVDTSRVDVTPGQPQILDVSVVLVDQPAMGSSASSGLVSYATTVAASGDIGWDAVNALLTTVASDGKAINGFNLGSDARYPIAEVNSVSVDNDKIIVDLDRDVWDPYPAIDCECPTGELVMQQLVWTLDGALDTDLPVLLTVNGEPARGIWLYRLDGPVAADREFHPHSRPLPPPGTSDGR